MKNLIIIAAIGKKNELGYKNDLIWRFKEDLQFFRDTTKGHYIVMGRKTYESMPKNLPERRYLIISQQGLNINDKLDKYGSSASPNDPSVISREMQPQNDALVFSSIGAFLKFALETNEDIYIVGGGAIYRELLNHTDKMILTEIAATAKENDVFFPAINKIEWNIQRGKMQKSESGIGYKRNIYNRK